MTRYIGLLWDAANPHWANAGQNLAQTILQRPGGWRTLLDTNGLHVLVAHTDEATPTVTRLDNQEGVIVGRLFRNGFENLGCPERLDAAASSRMVATAGGHLLHEFWGNYVGFWRAPRSGEVTVLRDPCGALPCHVAQISGVTVAFANIEDVADLPGFRASIDWSFVRSFIVSNYFATRHTGLEDVHELRPGERLRLPSGVSPLRDMAWDPVAIASRPSDITFAEASEELSALGQTCLGAWGRTYKNLAVRLSGGLDSSILLNLLARAPDAQVSAVHLASPIANDRELAMAELAAAQAGVKLVPVRYDPDAVDLRRIMTGARLIRPTKQVIGSHADDLVQDICAERGAKALVAGHGGDTLFLQRASAEHMFADYVRLSGFGRDFWSVAYATAMQLEIPVTEVLSRAAHNAVSSRGASAYPFLQSAAWRQQRLIRVEAIEAIPADYLERPWFARARRLPRGKAEHLLAIASLQHYHAARPSAFQRDALLPFLSQPIVAFCLKTPIYLFGWGGRDRALERDAFKAVLPDAIVRRTEKGLVDTSLLRVLNRNLSFLRELILDGVVLQQGWFDRDRVDKALTPEHLLRGAAMEDIYNLIAAEVWAQGWLNPARI